MLNDYVNKKVRILVTFLFEVVSILKDEIHSSGTVESVMKFYGTITRTDDQFIELAKIKFNLYNLDTEKTIEHSYPISINPPVSAGNKLLININHVPDSILTWRYLYE